MDQGNVSLVIDLVKTVGVPAALLFFMVWRFNGSIRSNTEAARANTMALTNLAARIETMGREIADGRERAVREIKDLVLRGRA
jgi:hypothetical protein